MSRKYALLVASMLIALSLGMASSAFAQAFPAPWPNQRSYGAQRAPDADLAPDDYEYGRPIARPGRGVRPDEDTDDDGAAGPRRPMQLGPQRRAPPAALPPDADPAYSTPVDYDDQIDWSEQTRNLVGDTTGEPAGTITINTRTRKLYLSLPDGRAVEYGIGVGRQGFAWKGVAAVGRKAFWPGWTPPPEMVMRRPDLPRHMDGGMENPLGARALYLFKGAKDTLFRIHGTNEPDTIGQAVSSGCIRMLNSDVVDLYKRVPKGARVVVL